MGSSPGGFVQQIYNAFGKKECAKYLNNAQKVITKFMEGNSFTLGYGDCMISKEQKKKNVDSVDVYIKKVDELIRSAYEGVYKPELDKKYIRESLEVDIKEILGKNFQEMIKDLNSNISKENNLFKAIFSGSKGKTTNIGQILGIVGPQDVWGERIKDGFDDRTLPHYHRYDIGPDAKGYVRHSYVDGLYPNEMYFHAMGGRTGVIDTAIKTADSGYISRKFIKATEDLMANYDGTVRNTMDIILQFQYGDDRYDPIQVESTPITLIGYDNNTMNKKYKFDDLEDKEYWLGFMTESAVNELMKSENYKEKLNEEFDKMMKFRSDLREIYFKNLDVVNNAKVFLPVNLYRLISIVKNDFNIKSFSLSDITPIYVIDEVNKMLSDIVKYSIDEEIKIPLHEISYMSFLASKMIIEEYRFNKVAFDFLIEKMKFKIFSSIVHPGEMIGIIASQTLGESSTQLTLNTFHLAGVGAGSKVITQGVPRLREIISLSKNMKISGCTVYIKEEYRNDEEAVRNLKTKLVYKKMEDIVQKTEIIYESNDDKLANESLEFIKVYNEFSDLFDMNNSDNINSKWVLRITFDKESLINSNLTVYNIQQIIKQKSSEKEKISYVFSDDNSSEVLLQISIDTAMDESGLEIMKDLEKSLMGLTLNGIPGIDKCDVGSVCVVKYMEDGSSKNEKETVIDVVGTNLRQLLKNKKVDSTRTISNDINEVYSIFGIEAARNHIIQELTDVYSGKPNPKHIQLITDLMTYKGKLMQIDRHGINRREDAGPIAKASFEEIMNIFVKAAVFSEEDNMKGVSANVFAGQFCKAGTNSFDILMDNKSIINNTIKNDDDYTVINKDTMDTEQLDDFISEDFKNNDTINEDNFEFGFDDLNTNEQVANISLPEEIDIKVIDKSNNVKNILINNKDLENIKIENENNNDDLFDEEEYDEINSDDDDEEFETDDSEEEDDENNNNEEDDTEEEENEDEEENDNEEENEENNDNVNNNKEEDNETDDDEEFETDDEEFESDDDEESSSDEED